MFFSVIHKLYNKESTLIIFFYYFNFTLRKELDSPKSLAMENHDCTIGTQSSSLDADSPEGLTEHSSIRTNSTQSAHRTTA